MATGSYKAAIGVQTDTSLPADTMWVTPHFSGTGSGAQLDTLASTLATAVNTYLNSGTPLIYVKIYQDGAPKPNHPVSATQIGSTFITAAHPRELALCASFYGTTNVPRRRGRLYIPFAWINAHVGAGQATAKRPTTTQQNGAKDFVVTALAALRAAPWTWCVRSDAAGDSYAVTNWYVDDEWDIQRRRGTKPTSRIVGTIP